MHYLYYTFYLKMLDLIATTKLLGGNWSPPSPPPPPPPSGDIPNTTAQFTPDILFEKTRCAKPILR